MKCYPAPLCFMPLGDDGTGTVCLKHNRMDLTVKFNVIQALLLQEKVPSQVRRGTVGTV